MSAMTENLCVAASRYAFDLQVIILGQLFESKNETVHKYCKLTNLFICECSYEFGFLRIPQQFEVNTLFYFKILFTCITRGI